ncbi:hypothetical protein PSQ40_04730 [Curvibacter sp. HBC61]|uniref:RecT family protein n=1 Tax=Curvibacter cyanobacteriorum TaxID=3026422 RepID=A0ABT5MUZ7_9BURK|nr:hypothetical protein [Curvibacter sp. HBC61]MDD0837870.1 hypothetical protein [Curvibacter sp. HBC61]
MQLTTQETSAVAAIKPAGQFDLSPQTFEQALTFSQYLAESDLVPKDFKGKAGNCLIAMQWGAELGLKPLQALQNLAIINGRPSLWGDAVLALVRASPACEWVIEEDEGDTAVCRVKRRGEPEQKRTFSMADAKTAGLLGKQGPWTQYPKRMRQMRARAFALRDVFPDVLRGLPVAEEVMDSEPKDMGPAEVVGEAAAPQVNVDAMIAEARKTKTDADALAYWKNNNGLLAKQPKDHQRLKDAVALHRKQLAESRTVDMPQAETEVTEPAAPSPAPAPAAPIVTYAQVMEKLKAATNEDALTVAADWIGEVADPQQRAELGNFFESRLAEMRG